MKPFRWDLSRTEQLGRLPIGDRSPAYPEFLPDLRSCSSRLLAFSNNGLLAFVGRSPESIFDYLSGILDDTSKAESLVHLNISNRYENLSEIRRATCEPLSALKNHFLECGLAPKAVLSRKQATLFVDLVASGGTFGHIAKFLFSWAEEDGILLRDLKKKTGFLGITWRTKTSPKTWRWQQNAGWVDELQIKNIRNISIPGELWDYLGNRQYKVTKSNPPDSWASDSILEPPRGEANLMALRRAYDLYERGRNDKHEFSALLSDEVAVEQEWFRNLIAELRGKSKP